MKLYYILFCLGALPFFTASSSYFIPLEVKGSGIFNIERHDIGIVFYVTVRNRGLEILHIVTKMVECCESITDDDTDCEFMRLLGGNMGTLAPNKTRNFTLIFPNLYPHNRRGDCLVEVCYRKASNQTGQLRHRIQFDTTIFKDHIPDVLINYYQPWEVKLCKSPDQDPLDNCQPVSCHMKYSGARGYFHRITQRCKRIPICMSDPNKEMPDIAYVPMSNICRNLEMAITEDDVRYLTRNEVDTQWKTAPPPKVSNMRCHHGHIDNESGVCVCDPGWSSTPFDRDQFNPSTVLYHMCTIRNRPDFLTRVISIVKKNYLLYITSMLASVGVILLLTFCGISFVMHNERRANKAKNK